MGAVVAILQNDGNLMECQVRRLAPHVALQDPAAGRLPDAYGFGWYTSTDVLLGRRPTGASSPLGLDRLAADADGEVLLAHARYATVGNAKDENTHPFRFRRWLFAHDGTVEAFSALRPALLASLPEYLRRSIAGETDSEHAFAVFLHQLREGGHLEDLDLDAKVAAQALASTVAKLDAWSREAGAQRASTLNFVATNGRVLVATRRGRPLHYALLEGILPCERDGLPANPRENDPQAGPHRRVKAVCLSTFLSQPNGFIEVPEGSTVAVSRSLLVAISPLAH